MPRKPDVPSPAQMLEVARLFYIDDLTKLEIAKRLQMDTRKVAALLKHARETGVVKISLHGTAETDLEQRLRAKYPHLQRVLIVPGPKITAEKYPEFLRQQLAVAAANYFDELVQNHPRGRAFHVGISGGETLLEFANAVPDRLRENVFIHGTSLIGHGRFQKGATHIIPGVCAAVLWSRCGRVPGTFEYATVPPLPFDLEQMAKVKAIRDVIRDIGEVEAVFAGIGMVRPPKEAPALKDKLTMTALLQPIITPDELIRQGAVADFSYCLVDAQGRSRENWRYFLTAGYGSAHPDIEFYKQMVEQKKKVIVMAGPFKIPALMAALRGQLFSVLITDEDSARQLAEARR